MRNRHRFRSLWDLAVPATRRSVGGPKPLRFQKRLAVAIVTIRKKGGLLGGRGEVSFRIFGSISDLSCFRN